MRDLGLPRKGDLHRYGWVAVGNWNRKMKLGIPGKIVKIKDLLMGSMET